MNDKIKINTHSSIKISDGGKVFYFDPFELEGRYNDADYIFVTHDHFDHLDPKSIANIKKKETKYICPSSIAETLVSDCGINDTALVIKINPYDRKELEEGIVIEAIPAYNIDKKFHQKEFLWVGYILEVNNTRYYIAGDTDLNDDIKKVKCDVAFVPIGGTYTMDVNDAAKLINIIKPKLAIPTHYGSVVGEEELGKKFMSLVDKDIEVKELIDFDSFRNGKQ